MPEMAGSIALCTVAAKWANTVQFGWENNNKYSTGWTSLTIALNTEARALEHANLDQLATDALVHALALDQAQAAHAVVSAAALIAQAVDAAVVRLQSGGRLVYVGAGTSGRLGLLDGVELNPTFSWPHERVKSLLAGGKEALFEAVEGAEDDAQAGARDVREAGVKKNDVVIVLAASGSTPFALGATQAARALGALTIGFANNPHSALAQEAEIGITLDTGPEVISGSTRLKAGTAQKIALNTLSSAIMVRLNKVYGNLMVDVRATNAKLRRRSVALTRMATDCDDTTATAALNANGFRVKCAIVMIGCRLDATAADARLAAVQGSVRAALASNL
jgi:N-acetylmuramic acid 6-phosphate etherase